ncbi:MAG: LPS export ABC transporter permease LptF [Thiohalomonadaceae bacterium]
MIIDRYIFRELAMTLLGVAFLLVLIIMSATFVRILAEAAEGAYPQQVVFTLFLLKSVPNLAVVLPLAFFLAVLLALGRLYKDSEMIVLAACGVAPNHILRSAGVLAAAVGLVVALFTLYIVPYTQEQSQRVLDVAQARTEIEGIAAGRFTTGGSGEHLVYVEEIGAERKTLSNVFAHSVTADGRTVVVSAARAHQYTNPDTGDRYLVLEDGYRYEGDPGQPDFRIIRFDTHGVRLEERAVVASRRSMYSLPTSALLRGGRARQAELQWRLAAPISTVLLGLLAVPLARTNPRQGRYGKLFVGLVIYIVYYNLLTVARSWVSRGAVPEWVGMWWVHLLMLGVVLFFLWRHGKMPRPWRLPSLRRAAA